MTNPPPHSPSPADSARVTPSVSNPKRAPTPANKEVAAWKQRALGLYFLLIAARLWDESSHAHDWLTRFDQSNAAYAARGLAPFVSDPHLNALRSYAIATACLAITHACAAIGLIITWPRWRWLRGTVTRLACALCVINALTLLFIPWSLSTNDEAIGAERTHIGYALGGTCIWLVIGAYLVTKDRLHQAIAQLWPPALRRVFRGKLLWNSIGWCLFLIALWFAAMAQQMFFSAFYRWTRSFW